MQQNLFDFAATYRPRAETAPYSNPTTSKAGAESMKTTMSALAQRILEAIKARPRTCDELENELNLSHQTCSARIRHLVLKNEVVDSGEKRFTASGRKAIVWRTKA